MTRFLSAFAVVFLLSMGAVAQQLNRVEVIQNAGEVAEIQNAMALWIEAVASKKTAGYESLLDTNSAEFYLRLQEMALSAGPTELSELSEVDQLQAMFFRSMLGADELRKLNVEQLITFAVQKGFIGMELRRGDVLKNIKVTGNRAQGRLYKFGLQARPDKYLQYFVKDQGVWRVSLQGERERLAGGFDAFVARSKLPRSEAAFLILEARLMRKFTPADFHANTATPLKKVANTEKHPNYVANFEQQFRLVSLRLPQTLIGLPAATLDDVSSALKYVLNPGDTLPGHPNITLASVTGDSAIFHRGDNPLDTVTVTLEDQDRLSRQLNNSSHSDAPQSTTLLDHAAEGQMYAGKMMMQWRNIGLRGRPQLLQQAWLTPDFGGEVGPTKSMVGLRVRKITPASFWDQIGLQQGDLLTQLNGTSITSLDAWKSILEIAQTEQELDLELLRNGNQLSYRARTVRPR